MNTQIQTCYRHGDRRAGVVCQRCDRPICPDCMRQASVGFHCPECTKSGAQKIVRPRDLVTKPMVTQVLIGINVAVALVGMSLQGDELVLRGGLIADNFLNGEPIGVANGEWYRIVTSGFLHAGLLHLGFNMFVLYQLGQLLEGALGRLRFTVVYFVAMFSGSLGVMILSPDSLTVGASGAVFGLMGAAVATLRQRGVNVMSTGLGGTIVLNLVITFTLSRYISVGGHVGGLIGGFLAGWILVDIGPRLLKDPSLILGVVVAMGVVVGGSAILIA
ncbi:MAG: rhomboid family intramembrane serine protease [Actinomycetota bacterium]|nr:rhomboid family intramembrane serine protease [Actinomycetota bacterium]